jgi:hypothetical protein
MARVPYHLWLQKDLIAEIERLKAEVESTLSAWKQCNLEWERFYKQKEARIVELEKNLGIADHTLASYAHGNSSPDLAIKVRNVILEETNKHWHRRVDEVNAELAGLRAALNIRCNEAVELKAHIAELEKCGTHGEVWQRGYSAGEMDVRGKLEPKLNSATALYLTAQKEIEQLKSELRRTKTGWNPF